VAYVGLPGAGWTSPAPGGALTLTGCTVIGKVYATLLSLVSDSVIWADDYPSGSTPGYGSSSSSGGGPGSGSLSSSVGAAGSGSSSSAGGGAGSGSSSSAVGGVGSGGSSSASLKSSGAGSGPGSSSAASGGSGPGGSGGGSGPGSSSSAAGGSGSTSVSASGSGSSGSGPSGSSSSGASWSSSGVPGAPPWSAPLWAARDQQGCVRFSYLPLHPIVPRPYKCVEERIGSPQPLFASLRYGDPAYCKLFASTDDTIRRGADDGGEMGAFHFVLAPLRETDLTIRIQEYLPVGLEFGIFYQT
jgi:hypothetical protein